jgi:hypothetical protein
MDFDFARFKQAVEGMDLDVWAACFHEDGEWVEYRHDQPPSKPLVMKGRDEIAAFLPKVKASNGTLSIEDEMGVGGRFAFRAVVTLPDGGRMISHAMLFVEDGLIRRQVDVEAWD